MSDRREDSVGAPLARRAFNVAGIDRRGDLRDPRSRANSSRRRAAGSCSVRVISSRLPNPLFGATRKERERNPARLARLGRGHRAGGVTPVEQATGPAVKTSSPCLPPRDAERAVGGIRAWGENPGRRASSLTTVLPFGCFRTRTSKSLRGPSLRPWAHTAASRRRPLPTTPAPARLRADLERVARRIAIARANGNPKARPMLNPRQHRPPPEKRPERIRWPSSSCRLGVISRAEYGVKNGRRPARPTRGRMDDEAILTLVRRLAHPHASGGAVIERAAILADGSDFASVIAWSGTRRGARGRSCSGFSARLTRIAAQQPRGRATPAAAPLCAAGWNSDLSQLSPRARRAGRQPRPRSRRHGHAHRRFDHACLFFCL